MILMATALALLVGTAHAATSQQQMKACNAEATQRGLEGEDRKAFLSECLAGKSTGTALPPQQEKKTKACDAEATGQGLQGEARQKFLSDCLAKEPAAEPTAPASIPEKPVPAVPAPVPTPQTAPIEPNR